MDECPHLVCSDANPAPEIPHNADFRDVILSSWPFSLTSEKHPAVSSCDDAVRKWSCKYGLIDSSDAMHQMHPLLALRSAELAGYGYSRASTDVLALAAQWVMWFFLLDDIFDEGVDGQSAARATVRLAPLRELLQTFGTRTETDGEVPGVESAFTDLLQRTAEIMASAQFNQFVVHMHWYFDSLVVEAKNRETNTMPSLSDYLRLRRDTGPVLPLLDLVEQAESIRLPSDFYGSREYRDMIGAAADIASWINDIFSAQKEIANGDVHNLVILLQRASGSSIVQAVHEAIGCIREHLDLFQAARHQVINLPAYSGLSRTAIEAIDTWASGLLSFQDHGAWYVQHSRYQPPEAATCNETGRLIDG